MTGVPYLIVLHAVSIATALGALRGLKPAEASAYTTNVPRRATKPSLPNLLETHVPPRLVEMPRVQPTEGG